MKRIYVFYFTVALLSVIIPTIASASCENHLYSGNFLAIRHRVHQALNEYRQAYQVCGNSFESLAGLSRSLNDRGEELNSEQSNQLYKQALQITDIMIKWYPDKSHSHFLRAVSLGNLALHASRGSQATLAVEIKKSLDLAQCLDPENIGIYIGKGILYRNIASLDRSSRILAFMLFSDLPRVTYKNAIETLKKGLAIDWNVPRLHYELALAYFQNNEPALARRHFKHCISMDQRDHQDIVVKEMAHQYIARLGRG